MSQREDFVKVALAEIGTKEVPANSNKVKYNDNNGQFWCGYFVMWCAKQVKLKIPNCVYTPGGVAGFQGKGSEPLQNIRNTNSEILTTQQQSRFFTPQAAPRSSGGVGIGRSANAPSGGAIPETSKKPVSAGSAGQEAAPGQISKIVEVGPGYNVVQLADGSVERRSGARNWRNNNPGNIEYGSFSKKYGAIGGDGRFAIFPSYEVGRKAKEALLLILSSVSSQSFP